MRKLNIVFFIIFLLALSGCNSNQDIKPTTEVPLVLEEHRSNSESHDSNPQILETFPIESPLPGDCFDMPDSNQNDTGVPIARNSDNEICTPNTVENCILNEDEHLLCVLPEEKLSPNPNNIDTKLYAIFRNTVDSVLFRTKGTITVSTVDPDGIGMQEFIFDITNAIDEDGSINDKKEIEAHLETLHTLQKNIGYGSSERQNFREYKSYYRIMNEIISPFLREDFILENLSSISNRVENDDVFITATFNSDMINNIDGDIDILLDITKDAEVNCIKIQHYSSYGTTSTMDYTFS